MKEHCCRFSSAKAVSHDECWHIQKHDLFSRLISVKSRQDECMFYKHHLCDVLHLIIMQHNTQVVPGDQSSDSQDSANVVEIGRCSFQVSDDDWKLELLRNDPVTSFANNVTLSPSNLRSLLSKIYIHEVDLYPWYPRRAETEVTEEWSSYKFCQSCITKPLPSNLRDIKFYPRFISMK